MGHLKTGFCINYYYLSELLGNFYVIGQCIQKGHLAAVIATDMFSKETGMTSKCIPRKK